MLGNAETGSSDCAVNEKIPQSDTLPSKTMSGASRMGLLTLDQRNSSKDIFISISGLIGAHSRARHVTATLHVCSLSVCACPILQEPERPLWLPNWARRWACQCSKSLWLTMCTWQTSTAIQHDTAFHFRSGGERGGDEVEGVIHTQTLAHNAMQPLLQCIFTVSVASAHLPILANHHVTTDNMYPSQQATTTSTVLLTHYSVLVWLACARPGGGVGLVC